MCVEMDTGGLLCSWMLKAEMIDREVWKMSSSRLIMWLTKARKINALSLVSTRRGVLLPCALYLNSSGFNSSRAEWVIFVNINSAQCACFEINFRNKQESSRMTFVICDRWWHSRIVMSSRLYIDFLLKSQTTLCGWGLYVGHSINYCCTFRYFWRFSLLWREWSRYFGYISMRFGWI